MQHPQRLAILLVALCAGCSSSGSARSSGEADGVPVTTGDEPTTTADGSTSPGGTGDDTGESGGDTTGGDEDGGTTSGDTTGGDTTGGDGDLPQVPMIDRTTEEIVLVDEAAQGFGGRTFEFEHYRNNAYGCGLSGNYTFMVMNPQDGDQTTEAPLWVYLHGGGSGYFDENGDYFGMRGQTAATWNEEETFVDLLGQVERRMTENNQPKDITLTRRALEGYRLVLVSMCDHDLYSGMGAPYLNNPNPAAQVNGMQATMAAVEYTVANYPTTDVFAHGTSAGSLGVFNLSVAFASEGTFLTGIIADFYLGERALPLLEEYAGDSPYAAGYDPDLMTQKLGWFGDLSNQIDFNQRIGGGYVDVPVLVLGGDQDPFCIGHRPPSAAAAAEGLNNCEYVYADVTETVANQPNSPHRVELLPGEGHVPTNDVTAANDIVDAFIGSILAGNPDRPFGD